MDDQSIITLFLFLVGQTVLIWRKLEKIDQKLNTAAVEQAKQKEQLNALKSDLRRIKTILGLS